MYYKIISQKNTLLSDLDIKVSLFQEVRKLFIDDKFKKHLAADGFQLQYLRQDPSRTLMGHQETPEEQCYPIKLKMSFQGEIDDGSFATARIKQNLRKLCNDYFMENNIDLKLGGSLFFHSYTSGASLDLQVGLVNCVNHIFKQRGISEFLLDFQKMCQCKVWITSS